MKIESDRASIYRILNRFREHEIIHKIVADEGKQHFTDCTKSKKPAIPGNHFYFRCTKCESIECLPTLVEFSVPEKYAIQQMNCVLVGVCKDSSQ